MKKYLFVALFPMLTWTINVCAQNSIINEIDYQQLESFIQLAKENNFRKKIFEANEKSAKSDVTATQLSYLDMFNAAYYYRPNNRVPIDAVNPYLVNGFQLGASVNLASLVQKPSLVKQAKQRHLVFELERQEYEVTLENEVKSRYYAYVLLNNQLKINTQSIQDSKVMFDQIQGQFEMGEVELETYNVAKASLSQSQSAMIQSEVEFLKAKDALEEIIGVKLDQFNKQ